MGESERAAVLIRKGEFFLSHEDYESLQALGPADGYVRRRYEAVKLLLQPSPPFPVGTVARRFGVSRRTVQRWMARYRALGVPGLRMGSRRPKTIVRKMTPEDEAAIVAIRERTGLGPDRIKVLLETARRTNCVTYSKRTILKVLQRHGLVESQRRTLQAWRTFEWGHPRDLVQLDLTELGPWSLATAIDDHSRRLWASLLEDATDREVFAWMEGRLPRFRNLLTDNGSQFDRANGRARAYCHAYGTHHIWSTPGHPQTLGKVGRVQKDLKRALVLAGWTDRADLSRKVSAYVAFYNHACVHRRTGSTPIQREGGEEDPSWFLNFVHVFGLEDVLSRTSRVSP